MGRLFTTYVEFKASNSNIFEVKIEFKVSFWRRENLPDVDDGCAFQLQLIHPDGINHED
jgi:hypothetical protein